MPKLLVFTEVGFNGISKEFTSNDPDLTLNGDDATFKSAIVLSPASNRRDDLSPYLFQSSDSAFTL